MNRCDKAKVLISLILVGTLLWAVPAVGSAQGQTREITDMWGRSVQISDRVERLAVSGNTARILIYAGCIDMLAGVTDADQTNNISMPYSVIHADALGALPSVGAGSTSGTTYYEAMIELAPDVIFANQDADTCQTIQQKTGIPVVGLNCSGVFSDQVYDALALIGQITGRQDSANRAVENLKGWQKDLYSRTRDIADDQKPSAYVGGVNYKGLRGIDGTCAHYPPFEAVHALNVADETGQAAEFQVDIEQLLVWNPEYLFLNPGNAELLSQDFEQNAALLNQLDAVKNGQIYTQLAYNYNSTNIELAVINAYYAGTILYPDRFADLDFAQLADDVFTAMLGAPFLGKLEQAGLGYKKLEFGAK